jgi:hypothetical protein
MRCEARKGNAIAPAPAPAPAPAAAAALMFEDSAHTGATSGDV